MPHSTLSALVFKLCAICLLSGCTVHGHSSEAVSSPRLELVAISVSDIDASLAWYQTLFPLELAQRNEYDGGIVVAFLEGAELRIELVKLANSIPFSPPDTNNPATRQGVGKLTFVVSDLSAYATRAKNMQANVLFALHRSESDGRCYLTLADPDNNWVQLVGDCDA